MKDSDAVGVSDFGITGIFGLGGVKSFERNVVRDHCFSVNDL